MSRLQRLIAEHCPVGVPLKALGQVGVFIRGNGLQKGDLTDGGVGAIHYGQIHTHYGTWTSETKSFVGEALAKKLRTASTGDLVIATTSEDDDAVAKAVAWLGADDVAVSGDAYIFRHSLDPRFASYFFQSESFQAQKKPRLTGTKVRRISGEALAKIQVPVPPLVVQKEIGALLDRFSKLESDLAGQIQSELEARRLQYRYYRDQLLSLEEQTNEQTKRMATLGDIVINLDSRRRPVTRAHRRAGEYPYYGANGVQDYVDDFIFDGTFLLIGEDGSVVNRDGTPVLNWATGKIWVNNHAHVLQAKADDINLRFLYHYLQTVDVSAYVTGGTQPKLNQANLNRIPVLVPPIDEQERIVDVLDRLAMLLNDLSKALPAEINARRQQYQHYRDRLLTFKMAA